MKILSIGNSFAMDTMEHLANVALDLGVEEVKMAYLYIGGCSINRHWTNAQSDLAEYKYYVNTGEGWEMTSDVSISTAVKEEVWDWISIQHGTGDGSFYTKLESYDKLLPLIQYVKNLAGDSTKIAFNMTWVGEPTREHHEIQYYEGNQLLIFEKISELTKNVIAQMKEIDMVSPTGVAIQNARTSRLETLTRDGYHLTKDVGRYIAALTFIKALTGIDVENIKWTPEGVGVYEKKVALESVRNAFLNQYSITRSEIE